MSALPYESPRVLRPSFVATDTPRLAASRAAEIAERDRILASLALPSLDFWWCRETCEARFRVFVRPDNEPNVVALQLLQVDGRPPAASERLLLEDELARELYDCGPTWRRLRSLIDGP